MKFKNIDLVDGYYKFYCSLHCMSINHKQKEKCLFNNKGITKEGLNIWFSSKLQKDLSKNNIQWFWGATHESFIRFLKSQGLSVVKFCLLSPSNNVNNIYKYWLCKECQRCPRNKECWIPEVSKPNHKKRPEYIIICYSEKFSQKHSFIVKRLQKIDLYFEKIAPYKEKVLLFILKIFDKDLRKR